MTEYIPLICTIIGCLITMYGCFTGVKRALSTNSYEQGQKDANIANELRNINQKLDDVIKDTISREEFAEYKQRQAVQDQRIIALEKNVFKKERDE